MKLEPQKALQASKLKTKAETAGEQEAKSKTKVGKRERRRAPRYTLVWSEEVQKLPDFNSDEVIELRKSALWRIRLAEAALACDPAIASLGPAAQIDDIVWSKFDVGKFSFCLEFRAAEIREYLVKLAASDDPNGGGAEKQEGKATAGAAPAKHQRSRGFLRVTRALFRFARRRLNRAAARVGAAGAHYVGRAVQSCCRTCRTAQARAADVAQRLESAFASARNWATAMRRLSFQCEYGGSPYRGSNSRLEARWVGQNSGLRVLLYSWISDEPPPVDWAADLFGVLPIDWAANLFGVAPEEERVLI